MAVFAIGAVTAGVMLVDSIETLPRAADIATEQTAGSRQAVEVPAAIITEVGGVYGLYQRSLNVGPPVTLVPAVAKTARRDEWQTRIGRLYRTGRDDTKLWWAHDFASTGGPADSTGNTSINDSTSGRLRARDVIQREIPGWWRAIATALSLAATGRAWAGMTEAQVEAAIAHVEAYLAGPHAATATLPYAVTGMQRWYDLQKARTPANDDTDADQYLSRFLFRWASAITWTTGYSDILQVSSGVLVPRDADGAWRILEGYAVGYAALPTGWIPENPT